MKLLDKEIIINVTCKKEVKARSVKFLQKEKNVFNHNINSVEFKGKTIIKGYAWKVGDIFIILKDGYIDTRTTRKAVLNSWDV